MKDYFFIPASKLSKVSEFRNLTNIIVDFEDSILVENIPSYLKTLERVPNYHEFWYRIPIRKSFEEPLDLALIVEFYKKGGKEFCDSKKLKLVLS